MVASKTQCGVCGEPVYYTGHDKEGWDVKHHFTEAGNCPNDPIDYRDRNGC